jgi:serine/threonine protein kinase/serine/threonine protein phosphatase PrpC/uncharacterized membrane protein YfcA
MYPFDDARRYDAARIARDPASRPHAATERQTRAMRARDGYAVLALAAFIGNAGVSVTGFGMAIVYWLVVQLADACGYSVEARYAIFLQSLSLLAAQPMLLRNARPRKYATPELMRLFVPVTVISTPLGQLVGDYVNVKALQLIAGILVLGVGLGEMYANRALIASAACALKPGASAAKTTEEAEEKTSIGDYHVLEELGSGTQATVKLAEHKHSKKQYAMKITKKSKPNSVDDAGAASSMTVDAMARKEAEFMKQLDHPNIIRLVEVLETDDRWYFVMELVRGGELFDQLAENGAYDEATARQIMRQLLEATEHMKMQGIMHRDLKPENVMLAEAITDVSTAPVVKIADFGLADYIQNSGKDSTFYGTPNYSSPEMLDPECAYKIEYSNACDLWSLGVVCYNLLAGFHPFDDECSDPPLLKQLQSGLFNFAHPVWENVSETAKSFIRGLLEVDPIKRLDASGALAHEWMTSSSSAPSGVARSGQYKKRSIDTSAPVFFMIGSQRSGSNWLRTMLDEREDLASPHPPHIMRDFMPILDKFGDLDVPERLRVLIDHVCTFVERNQVPWLTIHNRLIVFNRVEAERFVSDKLATLREKGGSVELPKGMHLLAIFDFVYNEFTISNDKRIWMCKSMGMSKYHDMLLQYYGEHRLRYVYLVRDPRDVAMSFMKTPVGDCHYYAIVTKWCALQDAVLPIIDTHPHLLLKVHYEELLSDKENTIKKIYDFIGKRRFGMGQRRGSVLGLDDVSTLIANAKHGRQAAAAANLSYQFQNLVRGESFAAKQHKKWLNGDDPLSRKDLLLIESVAHNHMKRLSYEPHIVPHKKDPLIFAQEQIAEFDRLNKIGIQNMMATLQVENPDDAARRKRQAEVLIRPAELISWNEDDVLVDIGGDMGASQYPREWPKNAEMYGYLTREEVAAGLTMQDCVTDCRDGTTIRWAALSQKGYYPTDFKKLKKNQDAFDLQVKVAGRDGKHWLAVFDGHGTTGDECSNFAKVGVFKEFESAMRRGDTASSAFRTAHIVVNQALHDHDAINDEKSGTTSVCMYVDDANLCIANVGDSVCMLGKLVSKEATGKTLEAKVLMKEHTLTDPDERKRIESCNGRVMKESQLDSAGAPPNVSPMRCFRKSLSLKEVDDGEQLRVYAAEGKNPGTAFSRSIGDAMAESLGVIAEPDVDHYALRKEDRVIVLCSDGITDFIAPGEVMEVCSLYKDPAEACRALVGEAYKRWISSEDRTDDITIIIGFRGDGNDTAGGGPLASSSPALTLQGKLWTISMGFLSGFLGGLCGIRGPPIILYFLHPPMKMSKAVQKGNGAVITAANVISRVVTYVIKSAVNTKNNQFTNDDWPLYIIIVVASIGGVAVGQDIFEMMKDTQATIKTILCFMLLLCGISLIIAGT